MKVIMNCVNIKLWDILGCFHYILNAPRMKKLSSSIALFWTVCSIVSRFFEISVRLAFESYLFQWKYKYNQLNWLHKSNCSSVMGSVTKTMALVRTTRSWTFFHGMIIIYLNDWIKNPVSRTDSIDSDHSWRIRIVIFQNQWAVTFTSESGCKARALGLLGAFTVGTRSEGVWILSNMHSNKNVRIFRLSQRSEERHPKFNRLLHECPKSYSVKNWPLVFVVCSSFPIAYDF